MQRTAFDGRVTFEVGNASLRGLVIREGFIRAVPEAVQFVGGTSSSILFENLIEMMSRTKAIITDVEETDANILTLAAFWQFARGNTDYRSVWNMFLDTINEDIHNEWMKSLINDELKAPPEVRPSAPSDEVLEQLGAEGEAFLAEGATT